jgi:hypothetical protein
LIAVTLVRAERARARAAAAAPAPAPPTDPVRVSDPELSALEYPELMSSLDFMWLQKINLLIQFKSFISGDRAHICR